MSSGFDNTEFRVDQLNNQDDTTPAALLEQLIYVDSFMPDSDPTSFDNQLTAELAAFADDSFIFPDEEKPKFNDDDNIPAVSGSNNSSNSNLDIISSNSNNSNNNNVLQFGVTPLHLNNQPAVLNNIYTNNSNVPEELGPQTTTSANQVESNSGSEINPDLLSQSLVTILSSQGSTNNSVIDSLSTSLLSNVPKVHVPPGALATLSSAGLSQIQIDALAALIAQHQTRTNDNVNLNSQGQNENSGFHNSAVNALNKLSNTANITNNFTPSQVGNDQPLSSLMTLLNANSNHDQSQNIKRESFSEIPSGSIFTQDKAQVIIQGSPQSDVVPSPSSVGVSPADAMKIQPGVSSGASPNSRSSDAADSDKRRRNTAASARFRIKKKLKQQEMERNIRELNENSMTLQRRIQQLEMENRLLRNLVVEKGAKRNKDELEKLKQRAREGSRMP